MSKSKRLVHKFYAVQDVVLTPAPPVELSYLGNFNPQQVRQEIIRLFEENQSKTKCQPMALVRCGKVTHLRSTDWARI